MWWGSAWLDLDFCEVKRGGISPKNLGLLQNELLEVQNTQT